MELQDTTAVDEIKHYVEGRYVSSAEAIWRLFNFSLFNAYPAVYRLPIHLPDHEGVRFEAHERLADVAARRPPITHLTGWFKLNREDPAAREHMYADIPKYYIWDKAKKEWRRRKHRGKSTPSIDVIGRTYTCHPGEGERYFLKLLLNEVPGAIDFQALLRDPLDNNLVHATFHAACIARGLLADDAEWDKCMKEATDEMLPHQIRGLFVTILTHCQPQAPLQLWDAHKDAMAEDFCFAMRPRGDTGPPSETIKALGLRKALLAIDRLLASHSMSLSNDFPSFPQPTPMPHADAHLPRYLEDVIPTMDNMATSTATMDANLPLLQQQPAQSSIYEAVMDAVDRAIVGHPTAPTLPTGNCHFVYSPGGCGKTFTFASILAAVKSKGHIALATTSSGIAGLLLDGGTTAHFRFKIPVENLNADSRCHIKAQGSNADVLRRAAIILIDEAPMLHRHAFEALDRTLRDITSVNAPFGGKVIICSGDFRQVLPVVPHASRSVIVGAGLQRSPLWKHFRLHRLETNMRVQRLEGAGRDASSLRQFASWLLDVGEGKTGSLVEIPPAMQARSVNAVGLIREIYGNIDTDPSTLKDGSLLSRGILAPLNADVQALNILATEMMGTLPASGGGMSAMEYLSADDVGADDNLNASVYPPEFLNMQVSPSPHCII